MLTRWNDQKQMTSFFDDFRRHMNRFFDDFPFEPALQSSMGDFGSFLKAPRFDVEEGDHQVTVRAEVPGFSEKDISISVVDNLLTIKAERTEEDKKGEKKDKGTFQSRSNFSSSYYLAGRFDLEKCAAELKNGLLTVTLTRAADSKPRQIQVKAS